MKRSIAVDNYISDAGKDAQAILRKLRSLFNSTIPEAEEKVSWGVPFYWWHGPLGGYAVYRNHVTFGCGGAEIPSRLRGRLERKGYKTGKKTVQIRFGQKVPTQELRSIILTRKRVLALLKVKHGAAGI